MMASTPLSVSELTIKIKQLMESGFSRLQVAGEVSKMNHHRSGHIYFTMKDADASLSAVIWRSTLERSNKTISANQSYTFSGYLSVYPPQGSYQMIVTGWQEAGEGKLAAKFEQLKTQLQQEGIFDTDRKQPLPEYPEHIAIITSEQASASFMVK